MPSSTINATGASDMTDMTDMTDLTNTADAADPADAANLAAADTPGAAAAAADTHWLRAAIDLSRRSREQGHHPFAALVVDQHGKVLGTGLNGSADDCTAHAEMLAVRAAWANRPATGLAGATLYSSAEPCAMCAGGVYWSGIGRVVYGLSEAALLALTGAHPENPTLSLPCREVFARGQRAIGVRGPLLEDEAAAAHAGFWG